MLSLRGIFSGTLCTSTGVVPLGDRPNLIVFRAMDLIAGLLKQQPNLAGLLYWAVGSGDLAWDTTPPQPNLRTTALQKEIYRKRIDAGQMAYDPTTKTLTINITFTPDEAVGTLREFGVFGGDAAAWPGSGYLFSYRAHPKIEKASGSILQRQLRLTIDSDLQLDSMVNLIAGLLSNQPGLSGIQYWANGSGDKAWDTTPPKPNKTDTKLTAEVYRKLVNPSDDITYQPLTQTLIVRSSYALNESPFVLREFGLFGGNASASRDSGFMINHQIHAALDNTTVEILTRQFLLRLGSSTIVAVPNIVGSTPADAATALATAKLGPGIVTQEENDPAAGKVLRQDPPAGTQVSQDMPVNMVVAIKTRRIVPQLTGLKIAEAVSVLSALNLIISSDPMNKKESNAEPDTILDQDPLAGTSVDQGTAIKVTMALPVTTLVPDITGLLLSAAPIVLQSANLALAPPPYPTADALTDLDTIASQSPAAGVRVILGKAIVPTLKALPLVTVPNLLGFMPQDAAGKLRDAAAAILRNMGQPVEPPGLSLGAQSSAENPAPPNSILHQDPLPGLGAPLYSAVSVTVAAPLSAKVPNLAGQPKSAVAGLLQAQGLVQGNVASQQSVASVDSVIDQDPAANTLASKGSTVDIKVATPITTAVPNLIGKNLDYAKEALSSANLKLGTGATKPSTQPVGTILDQTPGPDSLVPVGTQVAYSISGTTVPVPNLAGLTQDKAVRGLTAVNLALGAVGSVESTQAVGTVVSQSPGAGEQVLAASKVNLNLAVPKTVSIPSVIGMAVDQATMVLSGVQLKLASTAQTESDQTPNTVLTQDPIAGQVVVVGTNVNVTTAMPRTVQVPNLVNLTQAAAQTALAALKLQLVASGSAISNLAAGLIASQSPATGTKVSQGSSVSVVLSLGPKVNVPRLVGTSIEDAQSITQSLGLALAATVKVGGADGIVLQQSPAAGTPVDPHSTVHVVVGREVIRNPTPAKLPVNMRILPG